MNSSIEKKYRQLENKMHAYVILLMFPIIHQSQHLQGSSTPGDRHIPIFFPLTEREHFFLSIFYAKVINNLFRDRQRKNAILKTKPLTVIVEVIER